MKHLYFVSNNLVSKANVIHSKETTFKSAREKTMLSKKGEENAISLTKMKVLEGIEVVYTSEYFGAMNTGKYLAEEKRIDLVIDKRLNERVVGNLGTNEFRYLKGMQEHDFNFKLEDGESINDVQKRMEDFLLDVLISPEKNIMIVTHNIALMSLIAKYCNKGYNLYDRLILDYHDEVIFDGTFHGMDLIEFVYDEDKCVGFRRIL